jgi:predicted nucleotidyltransferase
VFSLLVRRPSTLERDRSDARGGPGTHATITDHGEAIAVLCERFHVVRLDVFGSAVTDRCDPATSDVDFLVEFADPTAASYADDYFGLLHELQTLLGRPVDLLTKKSIRNPYLRRRIESSLVPIYAP